MTEQDFKLAVSYAKLGQIKRVIMEADKAASEPRANPYYIRFLAYDYIKNIALSEDAVVDQNMIHN